MQRNRHFTFAMLLLIFAIGDVAAQAPARSPAQSPPAQPQQQPQSPGQPQGQPLLVVPSTPPPGPAVPRVDPELPTVELAPLLQRVERASGKRFLIDGRVGPRVYLGGVEPNDVTYPVLLAILQRNGFAAFESDGWVNIVPDANVRSYETRVVQADDASIPPDEFVTRVLPTVNINAATLVPLLRPLMPQSAHLAAQFDSSQLLMMDRYANIQRITAIVRALDVPPRNRAP